MLPASIVCADWSKDSGKRAVYLAQVPERIVRRLPGNWTLTSVLNVARSLAPRGPVVVAVDAPFGLPMTYVRAAERAFGWTSLTFLDLLPRLAAVPLFFESTTQAGAWAIDRPFFKVPGGPGSRKAYEAAARRKGVELYREVDVLTGANSLFITAGFAGTVGSGAVSLWRELLSELSSHSDFGLWPFEGSVPDLLQSRGVVLGEMYPRAAYASALLEEPPAVRPRLRIAKSNPEMRAMAVAALRAAQWVAHYDVEIRDLDVAEGNDDDFDACLAAAALLRCVLEGAPLCRRMPDLENVEGKILAMGSVALELPERAFRGALNGTRLSARRTARAATYGCPIVGCNKVFNGSRGGWDGHVGSLRIHPHWHPEMPDHHRRVALFRDEFLDFFT